ncbi:MAG: PQQ-binding-like beta-propeller repeat protein [Pseudomonadota bacterium]
MPRHKAIVVMGIVATALLVSSCTPAVRDTTDAALDPNNWTEFGRTGGEQHYSPLDSIDSANVAKLGLVWAMDLPPQNSVSAPLAIDGVIYTATGYTVVRAIDAVTGKLLWEYDSKATEASGRKLRQGWGIRGLAYGEGKLFVGTHDGRLLAIDAKTGALAWSSRTLPIGNASFISGPPRYFAGKVIIGFGGGDVSTDSIILGVGNGSPWNHKVRSEGKGDNLFLASVVALDAKTGSYKWHYQVNPGESWDYNASMDMELADLTIDGKPRQVLMTAPKNGFFYVIDRTNGKLISAKPFVKVSWAKRIDLKTGRPVEDPDARYPDGKTFTMWPGPVGAHTWLPMAFNPKAGLVYIPAIEMATSYNDVGITKANWVRAPGNAVDGAAIPNFVVKDAGPTNATSALVAWDPVRQRAAWKVPTPGPWNGGVMTTAGNLVFQGRIDGQFNAYAADSGKPLWRFAAQAPVTAPPISFAVNGTQYVTVITGMGTSGAAFGALLPVSIDYRTQARRILTFAIGGKATLPKADVTPLTPATDPDFAPDSAMEARGMLTYARHCAVCHGVDVIAAGHAPDLRASSVPLDPATFATVVRDGALVSNGMPRFEEFGDVELAALRQYIRRNGADLRMSVAQKPTKK